MPARANNSSFRHPRKATRNNKHTGNFDVVELCKRLEEIRRKQRAVSWSGRPKAAEELQSPAKVNEPYRHVPQTAATDFTRTTAPALGRARHSYRLSGPLTLSYTNAKSDTNDGWKLEKKSSVASGREIPEFQRNSCNRMSIASGQLATESKHLPSSDHVLLRKSAALKDRSTTRKETRSTHAEKQAAHVYHSLLEADVRFRMLSMGDIDQADLEGVDLSLRQDTPALAHKITRQHLDDRTNWTQSDASIGEGKHLLRNFITPLVRVKNSKHSKHSSNSDPTVLCSEVLQKKIERKNFSRREFNFLPHYFVKS